MVKIRGDSGIKGRLGNLSGPEAVRQMGAALFAAGQQIEVEAAHSITAGATSGKNHVPSSPGEPPNADTHVLDRSIETVQVAPLKVEVSANAPYAAALEFGTSKMQARPYMAPAVARTRDDVRAIFNRAARRIIDGGKVTG